MKMKAILLAGLMVSSTFAYADKQFTEAEVHEYRQMMQEVGEDWRADNSKAAFAKVKILAKKGFPEAQYILGTLYHDGEGTEANKAQATIWYRKAINQSTNPQIATLAREALTDLEQNRQ